jgi:hypothetical protein
MLIYHHINYIFFIMDIMIIVMAIESHINLIILQSN